MLGSNRRLQRLREEGMVGKWCGDTSGHPEREERASASEVCSSAGREWQLLHNNRGPKGEMEEALQ